MSPSALVLGLLCVQLLASASAFEDKRVLLEHSPLYKPRPYALEEFRRNSHIPCVPVESAGEKSGAGKKALVTGVAGFIGSHVAAHCVQLGMEVIGIDDLSGGFESNLPCGVHFYQGDVKDAEFLGALFTAHKFDYVYHLAAYAAEGLSHFIRSYNYRNNLVGSVEVLNQAVKHGVSCFVFTSSIAVYGAAQTPMTEETVPIPEDPYGIAKYAMELDLKAAQHMWGIDFIIFRPHNVYGPRQNMHDKYRNVIGIFLNQLLSGKQLTIFGDGEQTRSFSYIDSVAPVIARAPLVPKARNQVFNIGGDKPYTVNELANTICQVMGADPSGRIKHLDARKEVMHAEASHEKVKEYFPGAVVDMSLKEGLKRMVKAIGNETHVNEFDAVEVKKNIPPSWDRPDLAERDAIVHDGRLRTDLVLAVPTDAQSRKNRDFLRHQFKRFNYPDSKVVLYFFIGTLTGPAKAMVPINEDERKAVLAENKEHNDIVFLPCRDVGEEPESADGTAATTCKVYEACKWVTRHHHFKFMAKMADDSHINLREFFAAMHQLPASKLYMGHLMPSYIDTNDRFPDPIKRLFGMAGWPTYMLGNGYVLSEDVVRHIATTVVEPRQVAREDRIVGLWLTPFDVPKAHSPLFVNAQEWLPRPRPEIIMYFAMTPELWGKIDDRGVVLVPEDASKHYPDLSKYPNVAYN